MRDKQNEEKVENLSAGYTGSPSPSGTYLSPGEHSDGVAFSRREWGKESRGNVDISVLAPKPNLREVRDGRAGPPSGLQLRLGWRWEKERT